MHKLKAFATAPSKQSLNYTREGLNIGLKHSVFHLSSQEAPCQWFSAHERLLANTLMKYQDL